VSSGVSVWRSTLCIGERTRLSPHSTALKDGILEALFVEAVKSGGMKVCVILLWDANCSLRLLS
jgi:hypothetical protein